MQLRSGYKQTDIGVIPADWETHKIGDSMRLVNGRAFKPGDWAERGLPIIRIQNLNDGMSGFNYFQGTVEDRHRVAADDLLFAWSGTTGTSFGARVWVGAPGVLNQHIFKVIPNPKKLTQGYALLVLRQVQEQVEKQAHGFKASFVHVKKSDLVKVVLPIPPKRGEQEAIATVLSDADALVESLEQLLAKKRHLKQGTMQELLTGKKRLPGFAGEWQERPLGEIGESLIGLTYAPGDVRSSGVLVLRSSNVFEGGLRFDDNVYVDMEIPARIMVRAGDILICVRNGSRDLIGKCAKIDERCKGMTFGAFMAVFRTASHGFVYHQFQADQLKRQIREHLGATINQITNKSLNSFRIALPPTTEEQVAIAKVLDDMGAEVTALEGKLTKARQIKQGMMQELLTGRIRLV